MNLIADIVIVLTGLYLVGLAAVAMVLPDGAKRFLGGFAASGKAHYLELFVRLVVGGAMVFRADHMLFSRFFALFGWVLIVSTAVLFVVPWHLHRRFALWAVPHAVQYLGPVAMTSFIFGVFVLASILWA